MSNNEGKSSSFQVQGSLAQNSVKQQQQLQEQLRNTWRKAPQINSHKLPAPFNNILTNPNKKNKKNFFEAVNLSNSNNAALQQLDKIENIKEMNDYHQVQNLLSPLKREARNHSTNNRKDLPQYDINENAIEQLVKDKANSISNQNPLKPLQNYMDQFNQFSEQMKELPESMERVNQIMMQHQNLQNDAPKLLINSKFQLEQMITLGVMKGSRDTGAVQQMLHAPTLSLYAVKEEPISQQEVRKALKQWISLWQNQLCDSPHHVKVLGTYWNSPEGCVSIVMQHSNGGSLQNLLESVGNIPQGALQFIAGQVLLGLQQIHNELQVCHGALSPSQILFTQQGVVKLSLGLSYRVTQQNNFFNSVHLGQVGQRMSLYDPGPLNTPNIWNKNSLEQSHNNNTSELVQKSEDIFKFGLMMLISAIASFDVLDASPNLYDQIKQIIQDEYKGQNTELCCLYHSWDAVMNYNNPSYEQPTQQKSDCTISTLLNPKYFSNDFISFLCSCLKFNYHQRATIDSLLTHQFIVKKLEARGPKVTLKELIVLSCDWSRSEILPAEYFNASQKQLQRICDALQLVLPNCEQWYKESSFLDQVQHMAHINSDHEQIKDLSHDLGLNATTVFEQINQIFENINSYTEFKQKILSRNQDYQMSRDVTKGNSLSVNQTNQ